MTQLGKSISEYLRDPALDVAVIEPAIDQQRRECDCTDCLASAVLKALRADASSREQNA